MVKKKIMEVLMEELNFDNMSHKEIEARYIKYNIPYHYQFQNAEQVEKVFGWDFSTIIGLNDLSDGDKLQAEKLICAFINIYSLWYRHKHKPVRIKKLKDCYELTTINQDCAYLYFNGELGIIK